MICVGGFETTLIGLMKAVCEDGNKSMNRIQPASSDTKNLSRSGAGLGFVWHLANLSWSPFGHLCGTRAFRDKGIQT